MRKTINVRKPTTPGEILRSAFLVPLKLTQRQLAEHIGCDVKVINRIVNGRSVVTAEMAVKLGGSFGTTPEFWLNAQRATDLYHVGENAHCRPPSVLPQLKRGAVASLAGRHAAVLRELGESD